MVRLAVKRSLTTQFWNSKSIQGRIFPPLRSLKVICFSLLCFQTDCFIRAKSEDATLTTKPSPNPTWWSKLLSITGLFTQKSLLESISCRKNLCCKRLDLSFVPQEKEVADTTLLLCWHTHNQTQLSPKSTYSGYWARQAKQSSSRIQLKRWILWKPPSPQLCTAYHS
jgi:hypothetical protein